MAGEWAPIRLGDVCTKIGSGATPRGGSDVYLESGPYALIRSQNVYNDGFHHDGLAYIGEAHAAELDGVEVQEGDVLLNITGDSVARACQVDPGVLPARVNQHVAIIRPDLAKLEPRFLRYILVSSEMQIKLLSWAGSGGTRNALTKGMIESFDVLVPEDIDEQHAIAHILGTLDDKIELNRQMNETLEAMARALFKSWFVDFDPVCAKAEGRDPGLPKHMADLFPDSFEDSALGEIPKGWAVGRLGRLGELAIGGDWGEDESFEGAVEASCLRGVDLEHLRQTGQASAPRRWFKPSSLGRRAMDDRDVLVAGSGVGPTGRPLWICPGLLQALGPCVYSNFCKRIRCGNAAKAVYLDAWLHAMRESGEIWEHVNGTSVPNLDANSLLIGKEVPLPPAPILDRYHDFVRPIWQALYTGQNRTLATLRDTLLPKLVSGEIRIDRFEDRVGMGRRL